ncbi:MAG: hypothetical protein VCA18_06720 [Opitutales bacterium]
MITRRTQFISSMATGFLTILYAGCASLTIPEHPVDLRGDGMVRAKGDKMVMRSERKISGSLSMSGFNPGQGRIKGGVRFSGTRSNNAELEVTKVNGEGKAIELRASKIMQPYSARFTATAQGQTEKKNDGGEGSQHGEEYTMENDGSDWERPFAALQGVFASPKLFPGEKISVGHKWKPKDDLLEDILEAMPDMSGSVREAMPDDDFDIEATFKFKGLKEYHGENCAVIDIDISGSGKDPDSNAKITISGGGEIYRSLDSCRNLKTRLKINIKSSGSMRQRGVSMYVSLSLSMSVSEKEEMIHKVEPDPGKTDAESKEIINESK